MRFSDFAAALAIAASFALASPPAEAQFPKHLKSCKKDKPFLQEHWTTTVPAAGGGEGMVKIVSESFSCTNKQTRNGDSFDRYGMTDASGKVIVPFKYSDVVPISTTGAIVRDHPTDKPESYRYKVFTAGKGEGKDRFDFQSVGLLGPPAACLSGNSGDVALAAVGTNAFNLGGKVHATIFKPDGSFRRLDYLAVKDGLDSGAVQRVGDVLLIRWKDDSNIKRAGLLDIYGNQVSPVLGGVQVWETYPAGYRENASGRACRSNEALSTEMFFEGPSLDRDPARPFYGPLLTPVGVDGQPLALPKGVIGMFPVNKRDPYMRRGDRITEIWAVVFASAAGFEFTMHPGTPAEALAVAPTATRYLSLTRTGRYDLPVAQHASDGLWRTWNFMSPETVGIAAPTAQAAGDSAVNLFLAEAQANEAARLSAKAEAEAKQREGEQQRHAAYLASLSQQMGTPAFCNNPMPTTAGFNFILHYMENCAQRATFMEFAIAAEAGVGPDIIARARQTSAKASEQRQRETDWARAAELARLEGTSSYYPGQWSSAIQNAGNAAVDAINKSSDNWLQQRQDQYVADWQRSQRAY
jgi:hypothetical protein